mgnify:CR=1 FL=1
MAIDMLIRKNGINSVWISILKVSQNESVF